jgi:eukaryotic-like serine/threonine-protein kinase
VLKPGTVVDEKYRVERMLGKGGMGMVLAATHLSLGTRVALKFMHADMAKHPKVVERFFREARASAKLKSEHICRVSDVASIDGAPFIVMELLDGTDLAKVLAREGRLSVDRAADYVLQACIGIAEAHAAGIVHRDLKPGNLFLTTRADGTPLIKVLDFGVATAPRDDRNFSLTQTTTVLGSPGYMSPEQLRSGKGVDERTDIWALGVILFELLAGRQPFVADSLTELALKIGMDPTPTLPGDRPDLDAIVRRCLDKDPDKRYRNVAELADAIAPFAHEETRHRARKIKSVLAQPAVERLPETVRVRGAAVEDVESATEPDPSHASHATTTVERASRAKWPLIVAAVAIGAALALFVRRDEPQPRAEVVAPSAVTVAIDAQIAVAVDAQIAIAVDAQAVSVDADAVEPAATEPAATKPRVVEPTKPKPKRKPKQGAKQPPFGQPSREEDPFGALRK